MRTTRRHMLEVLAGLPLANLPALAAGKTSVIWHKQARPLPPLSFEDRAGTLRSLGQFPARLSVLHLWASWCGSCRTEFPSLLAFAERYKERDVGLITVSVDRLGWPIIERTLDELSVREMPVYLDRERTILSALGTFGLPTSLILDRDQREIGRIPGACDWQDPQITRPFEDLLQG